MTHLVEMDLYASTLDASEMTTGQKEFSLVTGKAGDKLVMEVEDAQNKKKARQDILSGHAEAREARTQLNIKLSQYLVGTTNVPVEMLAPPAEGEAYRDYDASHAKRCAEQMQTAGANYPHKPAVGCIFNVRIGELILVAL